MAGVVLGIVLMELAGLLVLGQEVLGQGVIPDGSTCCSEAEKLPCLGGGARQEPVAEFSQDKM